MSSERKQTESQILVDDEKSTKQWPVSLLGALTSSQPANDYQGLWPWLLSKAVFCPAAILGENETLFQEEEPADICCLQPHSLCGPTCRELNSHMCGFGNEGLKLFAHTCLLQAACSCVCLGLPFVAWLAALQRQKVVAKHGVDDNIDEPWLSTLLYPCSLLQMHALLKQQQRPPSHAYGAYMAPKVQQMTAADSGIQTPSQAPSMPGPLTSAMSTSKLVRSVHNHTIRAEVSSLRGRAAAGSRLTDSISSEARSGAVDGPDSDVKQDAQQLLIAPENASSATVLSKHLDRQDGNTLEQCNSSSKVADCPLQTGPLSARLPRQSSTGAAAGPCSCSAGGSQTPRDVEMAPLSARRREQQLQQQQLQQQGVGLRGPGTPSTAHSRPHLPPKPRSSTGSLQQATAAGSAAVVPTSPPILQLVVSPEPPSIEAEGCSEAAPTCTRASTHLPTIASANSVDVLAPASDSSCHVVLESQQPNRTGSCHDHLTGSKVSLAGSYSKLQLSHEDVPLMAIKPTPGRPPRALPGGAFSTSRSVRASLASSWQQKSTCDRQLMTASSCPADEPGMSSAALSVDSTAVAVQQCNPQYATMQSDICNYASWLGSREPSNTDLENERSVAQQSTNQSQQVSRAHSAHSSARSSDADDCPPPARQDSDVVVFGEVSSFSPVGSLSNQTAVAAGSPATGKDVTDANPGKQALKGRPRISDWAYMSDLCNLGGSFEVGASTGLAAALGRLVKESSRASAATCEAEEDDHEPLLSGGPSSHSVSSTNGVIRLTDSHQQSARARAASGSWPDADPSPPSTVHGTLDSQPASSLNGIPGHATQGSCLAAAGAITSLPTQSVHTHEKGEAASSFQSSDVGAGQAAASGSQALHRSSSNTAKLDSETLAAVTGTSAREQLTASQEQLAAKLAKLAFASTSAVKKLAGVQQSKQRQQGSSCKGQSSAVPVAAAAARVAEEPFYPTMMSDICNLAEPCDDEQGMQVVLAAEKSTEQVLCESAAASAAHESVLQSVQQLRPPARRQYKPAGHLVQHRASMQRRSLLKIAKTSTAGPLRSALLSRRGSKPGAAVRPGMARQITGGGAANNNPAREALDAAFGSEAAPTAAPGTYPLESFDSYYPDCDLNPSASDVAGTAAGRTDATPGKVTYVNPYYMYRNSTASSLVTTTVGMSPPKSPKRAVKAGHVAAAVAAFESAVAGDDDGEGESDLHAPWQQDKSRPSSPAIGSASPKGRWPIVDASVEAKAQ